MIKHGGLKNPTMTHSSETFDETGALVQLSAKYFSKTNNILVAYLQLVFNELT